MTLKLIIAALYATALLSPLVLGSRAGDSSEFLQAGRPAQTARPVMFDAQGRRGPVLFDHKKHEAALNPDPAAPHKAPANLACVGCHHTVKAVTEARQFQKCSSCHGAEGDSRNPDDREGFDLNSREAFHRLCIGCHKASGVRASNERLTNVSFTRCSECHDRAASVTPIAEVEEPLPAPDESGMAALEPEAGTEAAGTITTPRDAPRGYAGPSRIPAPEQESSDAVTVTDRWRIGFPPDPRFEEGRWYNPYRQNVLKGDYPLFGQHNFLVVTAESDTFFNARRVPVPSDISSQRPDSSEFFGRGGQTFFRQNFLLSVELFHGDAAFKPVDYRFRFTPSFNINVLNTQENGIVNIDPRKGANRTDGYVGFQEAFGEARLGDTTRLLPFLSGRGGTDGSSPFFDSTFIRAGIQPLVSDFRGFIFNDFNLGVRLFGQHANNRYNFNAAYFYMLEKDTNSELNTRLNLGEFRDQSVFIANLYRQDTKWKGYTAQLSFHYNNDRPGLHFDENDFLVRPAPVGDVAPHSVKSSYFGWAGDGHIGRLNITHALYQVIGRDTRNPIAGRRTDINAQMAALELSVDRDWLRFKGSFFFASGDKDPFDDKARGFDTIFDLPEFAGGRFSFWNSQGIRLTQTGVGLVQPESLIPSLRSSKAEGQSNFVNPGLLLYNVALDAELTPKLKGIFNANYLHFHHPEPVEELLFQPGINRSIGLDYGLGFIYRPFLSENTILSAGFSSLIPGPGFKEIYSSSCLGAAGCGAKPRSLYSAFVRLKFTY
ncbi:MAG TPA: cytochrome c3 family protein [Blastocatellia bacterium]|nr:cytochrome c3 family protein [Blastocatellia bacterium]